MKMKTLTILLLSTLSLSVCACGASAPTADSSTQPESSVESELAEDQEPADSVADTVDTLPDAAESENTEDTPDDADIVEAGEAAAAEENTAASADAAEEDTADYADVYAAISSDTWLFNGGGDTILNYIDFKEDKASVGQVYFDGNGLQDNGVNEYDYTITDSEIIVTTDGGELAIPYTIADDETILGTGEYFTLAQIDESLQGYWKYSYNSYGKKEGYLFVNDGKLKSESASAASGGAPGDYYYNGPYEGSYTLGIGCFETDLFKGRNWFYNIIDGVPTVLYFENVCVPADGFAGENGYSF